VLEKPRKERSTLSGCHKSLSVWISYTQHTQHRSVESFMW